MQLAFTSATDQVWSYPNLHGDVILTADHEGVRTGERVRFDPFGQPDPRMARSAPRPPMTRWSTTWTGRPITRGWVST